MISFYSNEKGMALVVCLLIMVVAAMIGIGVATDSTTSSRIAFNQRLITRDFFIAEGTNQIEVPKISNDPNLGLNDITGPAILKNDTTDDSVSDVSNDPPKYRATIQFHFYRPMKKAGYSIGLFNYYTFSTKTRAMRNGVKKASVKTVQNKIGPKI